MIFIEGYSNCAEVKLHASIGGQGPASFDQCLVDIEKVTNEQILGSELDCAQWYFPIQKNVLPKKSCEVRSNNVIARKFIENSVSLIELSIAGEERKVKHDAHANNSLLALALLRKKTDFAEVEINIF